MKKSKTKAPMAIPIIKPSFELGSALFIVAAIFTSSTEQQAFAQHCA
jgi:hypothetical protein